MDREKARQLLRQMLGPEAEFRDGQWEAIDRAANQRQRLLVVQRTGWGKSLVYFLAAKILREAGAGPALLISPLLALMRNQILAARKLGIRALTIHSENPGDWAEVEKALKHDQCDVLLVSPERLGNSAFLEKLLPLFQGHIGLFVVDEAHCISDWGHDFRPDYRRIVRILKMLPQSVPVLCTTATANNRVVADVQAQIPQLQVLRGPLLRESLKLYNVVLRDQSARPAWLAHFLPQIPGSGIIYTLTIQDSRRVAGWLQRQSIPARPYHADLEASERIEAEQMLLGNEVKALVATVALGMGFDKPDLGFVIHFQRPGSAIAYYQQVGRAGRAVESAYGILLNGREDDEIQDYFIRTAFPPAQLMEEVLRELQRGSRFTLDELGAALNFPRATLDKALRLLEVDGAVRREEHHYSRTANRWKADLLRSEQVTRQRRAELDQIRMYVNHDGCLMEFLARALDDPSPAPCGKCMNCAGKKERLPPPPELVEAAGEFLRNDTLILQPRELWPKPLLEELQKALPEALEWFETGRPKMSIPEKLRAREGRALCIYGDSGWGREVAQGKFQSGRFSEALVGAAADLVLHKWKPNPAPEWVTAIPSHRHAELVQDLAQRLAAKLGVPFLPVLRKRRQTLPQKQMQNNPMQLRNILRAFQVVEAAPQPVADAEEPAQRWPGVVHRWVRQMASALSSGPVLPPGPVLLVDDVVDSRWTLTVAAILLRQHGSGPVFPLALAKAAPRGG